jgi:hypothetical protein
LGALLGTSSLRSAAAADDDATTGRGRGNGTGFEALSDFEALSVMPPRTDRGGRRTALPNTLNRLSVTCWF